MASILFDDWVWSYSRLQSFEQCPWGFAQKYLYGEVQRGEQNFFSAYGSLVHELHERWYKGEIQKEQIIPTFIRQFIALPETDSKRRSRYLASGLNYFAQDIYTPDDIVGVEQRLKFHVGKYRFIGIADLLYRENGGLVIMDHKSHDLQPRSGKRKPTIKDQELDRYLRQLYLYAHACRELKLGQVTKLVFNCFKSGIRIEEPYSAAGELEAVNWAIDSIKRIENSTVFLPMPDWFFCHNLCDTRSVCDYK